MNLQTMGSFLSPEDLAAERRRQTPLLLLLPHHHIHHHTHHHLILLLAAKLYCLVSYFLLPRNRYPRDLLQSDH